jgi:hypothetical protein
MAGRKITSPAPHRRWCRALPEARWSSTPLTPMLKSSRRYHPTAMGSSCTAHSRGCPQAPSVNAGVSRRSRCRWARIRSGIASPLGRRPGECGTGACSSGMGAAVAGITMASMARAQQRAPGPLREIERNCAIRINVGYRRWGILEVSLHELRNNNRTAHHANTHTRPGYHHPGGRSSHSGERAGSQYESGDFNPAAIEPSAEFAEPGSQCQCFAEPNTLAVAVAFAGTGDRRTALATAPVAAGGAGRAAFRVRIVARPLRLPSPVAS